MEQLPALLNQADSTLALPSTFLNSLQQPEDYENAFQYVTEQKNNCIWWEADIILAYYKKFVGKHLDIYRTGQLMNSSTIKYYLRTAAGFAPKQRIPSVSFNHHYQSTFADEWDSKTLKFVGDKRFLYAERAADEQLSTRKLKEIMTIDESKKASLEEIHLCALCNTMGHLFVYKIYKEGKRSPIGSIRCHELCFAKGFGEFL